MAAWAGAASAAEPPQIRVEAELERVWLVMQSVAHERTSVATDEDGKTTVLRQRGERNEAGITLTVRCERDSRTGETRRQGRIHLPVHVGARPVPRAANARWIATQVLTGRQRTWTVDTTVNGRSAGAGRLRAPTAERLDGTTHPVVETDGLAIIEAAIAGGRLEIRDGNHRERWWGLFEAREVDEATAAAALRFCSRVRGGRSER